MAATPQASSSAFHNLVSVTSNATSHLGALPGDLAHFLANAASFAFITVPERIDSIFHGHGSVIAEATGNESGRIVSAAMSGPPSALPPSSTARIFAAWVGSESADQRSPNLATIAFHQMRNLGGFFTYVTSRWALATAILALVFNRVHIYASMRRTLRIRWPIRLALRLVPIMMFLTHALGLLQALRCQMSPNRPYAQQGEDQKDFENFVGERGIMYWLASRLLFMETEETSCLAVGMRSPDPENIPRKGSMSLLWPLFQALWLGQFVETLLTVLQGRTPATETGMTIFEHSLAFAEAEGILSNSLGLGPLRPSALQSKDGIAMLRTTKDPRALLQMMNTPPENLLISLVSAMNNVSSQILGVFDMQARFRLVNTSIWGLCYLATFFWGFGKLHTDPESMAMRFPVVCVVGFTPHLLISIGILICTLIYGLALLICFLTPPAEIRRLPFRDRLHWACENIQAHTHLSSFRISRSHDFYTALLQAGLTALTAASDAVFLNERPKVRVAKFTWLEEQRLDEFEKVLTSRDSASGQKSGKQTAVLEGDRAAWVSGYARQKLHKIKKPELRRELDSDGGVGAFRRVRKCIDVYQFFAGIFALLGVSMKLLLNKILDRLGVLRRPNWLRLSKSSENSSDARIPRDGRRGRNGSLDFWMLDADGSISLPKNDHVDVAEETRRRLTLSNDEQRPPDDEQLDSHLYSWWKHGGWWGEQDGSGSYAASTQDDEDTTSMISMSTNATDWSDEDDSPEPNSGRTTPTQLHPYPRHRSQSPPAAADYALDTAHLAALLDPKDAASRQEAKMLAHHLVAPTITTRSRYAYAQSFANAKILTSTHHRPPGSSVPVTGPLSPLEEMQLLEQLILSRRSRTLIPSATSSTADAGSSGQDWGSGGPGMGSSGPSCVVCQSAPRTVIAWPCRCLSLCEDCRVSLAMNNFGTCVCCRQDVIGFSRLYVP